LLGIREKFKLPQLSLQGIVQGVTNLIQQSTSILKSKVCQHAYTLSVHSNYIVVQALKTLHSTDIHHSDLLEVDEHFHQYEHPFVNLETTNVVLQRNFQPNDKFMAGGIFYFTMTFRNLLELYLVHIVYGKEMVSKDVWLMKTVLCIC